MSDNSSFDALITRLRAGDDEAAATLFRRYAHRLIALVRTRLAPQVRQKVDPEDVLQSVFRSFFRRQQEGQWDLGDWDSLWGLLALLTVRKCARRAAEYRSQRRDVRREAAPPDARDDSSVWEMVGREPTPEEAVALAETVEQIAARLDEPHRDIFRLALEGHTTAEIATRVNLTERTVQRVLKRVREMLEKLASGDERDG